jgi:hypothetical protein
MLAEYTPKYILQIRNACKNNKPNKGIELWIFTEKGLFMETKDIWKRYEHDHEKVKEYYRSDEAVEDLRKLLESTAE